MTDLVVDNVFKTFPVARKKFLGPTPGSLTALDGVSLRIPEGGRYGLVGESGSGKSTLARCIVGLETLSSGRILFNEGDISNADRATRMRLHSMIQIVFQDPYSSLNPRMKVADIISEPIVVHQKRLNMNRQQRRERVVYLLERVGLLAGHGERYPHEFSGGQRQRIAIARSLAAEPKLLVLDEPTSALDVSVQAQVLDLLLELQASMNLTYLFVSHDLGAVRYACNEVGVLQRGRMVEQGSTAAVFDAPQSPYTKTLLASVPDIDPDTSIARRLGHR